MPSLHASIAPFSISFLHPCVQSTSPLFPYTTLFRSVVGKVDVRLSTEISEVPIVLGVKGPRALAMAGEIADGVLLSVLSGLPYVHWAVAQMGVAAYAG